MTGALLIALASLGDGASLAIAVLDGLIEEFVNIVVGDAQFTGPADEALGFLLEELALGLEPAGRQAVGDVGSVAMTALEQTLGGELLVDPQNGVLVDG
jgi:hypothetical protein